MLADEFSAAFPFESKSTCFLSDYADESAEARDGKLHYETAEAVDRYWEPRSSPACLEKT